GGVTSFNDSVTCTRVGQSLIAGNAGSDVATVEIASTQRFYSLDYNLIGAAGSNVDFGQEFNLPHDQVNVANPALAPLADNGGDTATHALLPGSPAIDAIPVLSCTLATDQRGVSRPQPADGNCDIGAFESYGYMIFLPVVLRNP
ncbi:MAG TPA: choice-of-anchor Q domain-containing protein, partial [Anaerolineae bacterium]|nr:choice-of-anchor Q domain-containing protein [Anaerolineae bacterium]